MIEGSITKLNHRRILYVGGLDKEVSRELLFAAFIPFGPLKDVEIPLRFRSAIPKGFGYVEYEDEDDAQAAIDNMDDSELMGKVIRVQISKPSKTGATSNKPIWAETDTWRDSTNDTSSKETVVQEGELKE